MYQGVLLIMIGVVFSRMFMVWATSREGAYPASMGHMMQAQVSTLLDGPCSSFGSMESVYQMTCLPCHVVCKFLDSISCTELCSPKVLNGCWCDPLLMLQSIDTVSLGMSSWITEPPMGLLTHLQSHSWELIDAGVSNSKSVICENKI